MAQIALVAAATTSGAETAGLVVASALGGVIDGLWVYPTLLPGEESQVGRLDTMNIMRTEEGSPFNYPFGVTGIRVPAKPFWLGDVEELEQTSSPGKGGEITNFVYHQSAAFAYAARTLHQLVIVRADGKVIWDLNSDLNETGGCKMGSKFQGGATFTDGVVTSQSLTNPDLTDLRVGGNVTMSGWAKAGNNGTFAVVDKWKDGSNWKVELSRTSGNFEREDTAFVTVTLTQSNTERILGLADEDNFHDGSQVAADSIIEAEEGAGNVPTHEGHAIHTWQKLRLTKNFANRIPNMEAEIVPDSSLNFDGLAQALMELAGLTASSWDLSSVTGVGPVRGYNVTGDQSIIKALQPPMVAHDVLAHESAGALTFFSRSEAPEVRIPAADVIGDILVEEVERSALPHEIVVSYIDEASDFQTRTKRATLPNNANRPVSRVNLPLVMTPTEAQALADKLLRRAWTDLRSFSVELPPKYLILEPNDALLVEDEESGVTWRMLAQRVERGANGLIRVHGIEDTSTAIEAAVA